VVIVLGQLPAPAPAAAQVDLLAIGAGQCALYRSPSGNTYIFDAGTRSSLDAYEQALRPFLRAQRLPSPQAAFISHANTDHYNAVAGLVRAGLRRVYMNKYFGLLGNEPQAEAGLFLKMLEDNHVEIIRISAGQVIQLDEHTTVEVLWPPTTVTAQAADPRKLDRAINDTSLVLRVSCMGKSIIFTGDIEVAGQTGLLRDIPPSILHADALVLPHHGSWDKSVLDFTKHVAPAVALVSASHQPQFIDNAAGQGRKDFYNWLDQNTRLYSTANKGWIRLTLGPGKNQVQTMR